MINKQTNDISREKIMNYFTDKQILEYIMQKFIDNKWSHVIINNLIKKNW